MTMAPSSSRNGAKVRLVTIHTAEGSRTKESLGLYFNGGVDASSHVGIDAGGMQQYVDYSRAAWTLRSGNPISDNAELCAFARWTRAQWLGTATVDGCVNPRRILENAAAWTRDRCNARGIPKVKLSPADVRAGKAGVIGHIDWTLGMNDGTHTDPGGNFPWDVFMGLVNGNQLMEDDVSAQDVWDLPVPVIDQPPMPAKDVNARTNQAAWLAANGIARVETRLAAMDDKLDDNQVALLATISSHETHVDLTNEQMQLLLAGMSAASKQGLRELLREGTETA
jgi:hypothetical protein